jgi:hypothetical protein
MGTCAATNKDGTPCQNDASEGSQFCHVHQPQDEPTDAERRADEPRFGTMLGGAFVVIFLTYALLRFVLSV